VNRIVKTGLLPCLSVLLAVLVLMASCGGTGQKADLPAEGETSPPQANVLQQSPDNAPELAASAGGAGMGDTAKTEK
jgi:hypothetical protein